MRKVLVLVVIALVSVTFLFSTFMLGKPTTKEYENVNVAIEFNNHAAYIAKHFDWFKETGLNTATFNSYVTGVALMNALARGDVDAAYLCLGPALIVYSRGLDRVILSGTHIHRFSIITREEITTPKDLEGKKVGVVEAGSNSDVFFQMFVKNAI